MNYFSSFSIKVCWLMSVIAVKIFHVLYNLKLIIFQLRVVFLMPSCIISKEVGKAGVLVLNRPQRLNAINFNMIK